MVNPDTDDVIGEYRNSEGHILTVKRKGPWLEVQDPKWSDPAPGKGSMLIPGKYDALTADILREIGFSKVTS